MTSEAVMHPDDECRPVAWQPSNAFSELMGSPVDPAPPPLQPGDAVWVRAVYERVTDKGHAVRWDDCDFGSALGHVPTSAIRRIEGEVKP